MPAAAPDSSKTLMMAGLGGGALLLVVVLFFVFNGGDEKKPVARRGDAAPAAAAEKPKAVDVSALEEEGKRKCGEAEKICDAKAPQFKSAPPDQKEKLRAELESALKMLTEGLAAYKKAAELSGKKYDVAVYERTRKAALKVWSADVEKEALASCEDGWKTIQGLESLMSAETQGLSDDQRKQLQSGLEKAKKQIEHGMGLCSRCQDLTGEGFDVTKYGNAYKAAKMKLLELK